MSLGLTHVKIDVTHSKVILNLQILCIDSLVQSMIQKWRLNHHADGVQIERFYLVSRPFEMNEFAAIIGTEKPIFRPKGMSFIISRLISLSNSTTSNQLCS